MSRVAGAAASTVSAASRIITRIRLVTAGYENIADAMRPRVITLHRNAFSSAALNRKQQAVVVRRTFIAELRNVGEVLSLCRILQIEEPALVRISGRRARSVGPA